jgi:hypothetical protein
MATTVRNWFFGILAVVVLIVGVPLAQYAFGSIASRPAADDQEMSRTLAPPNTIKVGDNYYRIVPVGTDAVSVQLFNERYGFTAATENELALSFSLPSGEKEILRVVSKPETECDMEGHSPGEEDCCASEVVAHPEGCPFEGQYGGA